MQLVTVDFETFYETGFSLSNLTTEEYLRDARFQVIGVAIKVDEAETYWVTGSHEVIQEALNKIDWKNSALLCHNTQFDGAILAFRFGIIPGLYLDTLSMARATNGVEVGGSLAYLVEHYELGVKGTEVVQAKGKRLEDFSPTELSAYAGYCVNDVNLTYKLFGVLAPKFPQSEIDLIDLTLRMYTQPLLEVDDALLQDRLIEVQAEKSELLQGLMVKLECETEECVRAKLASNKQFAEILQELGVIVPTKISPATGKETYALAKGDQGFLDLCEHEDPFIQQLCTVRLGTKSTIEESRIERFIGIGSRNKGKLPIPLKYYGAHTGRWAGSDKVNFQNLPARDKKKKALKNAIIPPEGYKVINADSSQIEARVLVWLAGQNDVVQWYKEERDVYCEFATTVYERPITKANKTERAVGKTCIAEGTPVLCESGWKPIEQVSVNDRVWDGEEWVWHRGLMMNGYKETLNLCGSWLTPDHQVWSGTDWLEARWLKQDESILSQALDTAVENLPLQGMLRANLWALKPLLSNVIVKPLNIWSTNITLKILKVRDAISAQKKRLVKNGIGRILKPFQTTLTELDFLTGLRPQYLVATRNHVGYFTTTAGGVFEYIKDGGTIKHRFLNMFKRLMDGMSQNIKWIGSTIIKGMSRAISGLFLQATMQRTKEKSENLKQKLRVYDLLSVGQKNRFTILTNSGPLIVHNCILGLGYGTGWAKLQQTLKLAAGVELDERECKRLVSVYRNINSKVIDLWRECEEALRDIASWPDGKQPYPIGQHNALYATPQGIKLPNGLYIKYPGLTWDTSEAKSKFIYKSRRGFISIWGGSVVENVVQALARIIIGEQMLKINEKYRPVLTVHDAVVNVIPEAEIDDAMKYIIGTMSTPPDWATTLPVACEAHFGDSYGDC